ncbi:hypothetical protein Celaphus_00016759 [Cervus elaphus hippelaphus]|uniref:Uncharacterized protein n=1 Tax=Cervus elaphus hippelaphus TaxID=46360 RepID=A0A212C4N0_CEREH|nr:hypothetical protein Celaphus_00016759 [Cervus elaphus hippelaphus]
MTCTQYFRKIVPSTLEKSCKGTGIEKF